MAGVTRGARFRAVRNAALDKIEVWDLYRSIKCRHCGEARANPKTRRVGDFSSIREAIDAMNMKRKNVRVRTFYSRGRRRRIIQLITGNGSGW